METIRIQQNDSERIEAYFVNTASVPLTGLNPTLTIRRHSDKFYWTGNQDFTSSFTQVTMSAVNATNQGGYYERTFDTTGLADATYSIIASGTSSANSPQTGELKVGGYIDRIDASIRDTSNAIGGGTVVTLDGILSQKDKTLLISAIKDEFYKILSSLDAIKIAVDSLSSKDNSKEIQLIRQDVNDLTNSLQLKEIDKELNNVLQEVNNA